MASFNGSASFLAFPTLEKRSFSGGKGNSYAGQAEGHLQVSTQFPTAKLRVIHNQDLLYLILSSFSPPTSKSSASTILERNSPPPLPSLLAASLTCKSFFNPAIRVMWYETTLTSLLLVIPILTKREGRYVLDGIVKEEYMKRFDLYAQYVRRLYIVNEAFPTEICAIISRLRHPVLLPAIRALKFASPADAPLRNVGSLLLVTSTTLAKVHIGPVESASDIVVASFLQGLVPEALQWLRLEGDLTHITLSLLPQFPRLTYLYLDFHSTTDEDIIGICTRVPMLQTLNLKFKTEFKCKASPTAGFASLQILALSATVSFMANLLDIFQRIQMPKLMAIDLHICISRTTSESSQHLVRCVKACAQMAQPTTFKALTIGAAMLATWDTFSPLQSLNHLTKFVISVGVLSVTNEDILDFLGKENVCNQAGSVYCALAPSVLGIFARNCPRLTAITLSVHIRPDQNLISALEVETDGHTTPLNHLKSLRISLAPTLLQDGNIDGRETYNVVSAAAVSCYINYCFPDLKTIKIDGSNNDPEVDWAKGVEIMVRSYHDSEMRRRILV
ncbi:hypothetical protein CPB84DRAFT_1775967 [Gymnopilus junonius]|uniref:Uncharacterized protein n=1 Tax=Gymnopilus junonius TaxID=109634 RepID=A0A9P5NQX0_GYMJU|nr:hypothetical protein CPB84DRAFT_1775967 [Gymnopilus junonius]